VINRCLALTYITVPKLLNGIVSKFPLEKKSEMRYLSYLSIISPAELKLKAEQMGTVKGIVHPKMKMFSSFTYPKVVPNLYEFISAVKQVFFLLWKSMAYINCLVTNILQNILCVQQKKETHTGLEKLEGE